ncbi:6-bladed beta-propeller [candidate division KSB1 bacterium]|nr:6-bladed beta-propeller [candidate division KSB1 bacterium]
MRIIQIVGITLCVALLPACVGLFDVDPHSPANRYLAGDMILVERENLLAAQSSLSLFCDENWCDFTSVRDIAVSESQTIFILNDYGEILIMNEAGTPQRFFESYGQGPGEMISPTVIKVRDQTLYVLDSGSNKFVLFDLDGTWMKDIVIHDILVTAFAVDDEGLIYIPRLVPRFLGNGEMALLHVYNEEGDLLKALAQNSVVQNDLLNIPTTPLICLAKDADIVLGLNIQGVFYLFTREGEFRQRFHIRRGAEWRESVRFQRALDKQFGHGNSWRNRVENMSVDSRGTIYATFGGEFKKQRTLALIYDDRGQFIGRLFGNAGLPFAPTCFQLATDSTAWIYSREQEFLGMCKMRRRKDD